MVVPMKTDEASFPLPDGTVYSQRKNFRPFTTPPLKDYAAIVGQERIERLLAAAEPLKGMKILELNATARGGGVAEMLFSAIPLVNELGIDTEWKTIRGNREYFECTKNLHNLLQGKKGAFTPEMEQSYLRTMEESARTDLIDYHPDIVLAHDPQPLGLTHSLKKPGQTWLWRCHIDIEQESLLSNPGLWDFITQWTNHYDAAIFSAAHYVISRWPLTKFIIPPFIDPLSEKNRELSQDEIDKVLAKYHIDPSIPIIAQVGRFDPWKGINRTITAYREASVKWKCQLILAGGLASDDPQGEIILEKALHETANDENIHVLNLQMDDRLENWREVNALQRAASVIMQPSTKEGFGLVITEALWKSKPVIGADVGAIPLQIRDGDTGYLYETPRKAAQKIIYLLENPDVAQRLGERGKTYVSNHFMLPDRIADWLMAVNLTLNKSLCRECIVSFHPWFKLPKRRHDEDSLLWE